MRTYQKIHEIKNAAKDTLDGKYSGAIAILLVSTLIANAVVSWISAIVGGVSVSASAITGSQVTALIAEILIQLILLLANILLGVMNAGIALYFLNLACGQPCSLSNLFFGYRTDSKKSLFISGALVLAQTVCLFPYQYFVSKMILSWDEKYLLYAGVSLVIGMIIYLPIAMGLELCFYFMLDFPSLSAKETLAFCWNKMKGQKLRLFRLELSFLPLMILCALSFGIGNLWLRPYMQMAQTKFYLNMMNPEE